MDGFDEKRRSMKQELLRRALLLKVENSKERSALYDVPTTRCSTQPRGIPLTKEPQLVRNMQRNFSNSRWEPLPGTGLAQREIAGCLECGEATPKKLCLKCRAKEKGYRGSRASSLNYPSSWNLEMVEDSQVVDGRSAELSPSDITNCDALHRTIYDQRLADHSGGANHQKKIDNCVQCSLRPMTKSSTMEPTIEDNSRIRQVLEKPKQRMRHKSVQSDMGYVSKQVSSSPDIVRMEHVIDASGFGKQRVFSGEAGGQSENACSCCCVWGKYPSPGSTHATNAAGISRNNDGYTSSAIDSRASNDNETIKNQQKVGEMHYPTSEHLKIIEHISRPPTMMDTTIPIRKSDSVTQQEKYESNQNGVSRMDYVPNSRERSNEKKKISSRNESYEQYSYNPSNESLSHKQAAVNSSIQCPCCSNAMTQTEEIRQKLDETAGSKRRQSVNLVKTGHKGSKRRQFKKGAPPHPLNGVQPSPRGNELLPISRTAPTIKQTGKQIPNYSTIKTQQFQSSSLPECIVVRGNHLAENCCQFQIRNCCKPITKQPASSNPFIQLHKSCQCPACIKCRTKATMPTINPSRKPNDDQMAKEKLEKVKTTEPESSMPKYDVKVTSAKAKIQPNKAPENSYPDAKSPVTSRSKANSNPSSTYSDASIKSKSDCICHKCGAPIDQFTKKAKTARDSSNESHRYQLNQRSAKQLQDEIKKEKNKCQSTATMNMNWNTLREQIPSKDYQKNCCTTATCLNQCGKCRITPAKMKKGDVMANLVVDDKCDVNQIIEILRETVVGLEKQEQLLRQKISIVDQNSFIESSASDFLPHTNSNYRYNLTLENYYNKIPNYTTSQASNQFNSDFHNQGYQGKGPNDVSYNSFPQQYNYYQQPYAQTVKVARKSQVQAEIPTQMDYDYLLNESEQQISRQNENSLVQCNCENQAEIDNRGYSNENINHLRITDSNASVKARSRTRSGGNPDTIEKDLKACTILSCDNKKCKTPQSLKPTQSFIQIFHMAMALRKNGTSFQKDPIKNSYFKTKLQRRRPEDQKAQVSLKTKMFLDIPDYGSYESHTLNGISAKKDSRKQPKRETTQEVESMVNIQKNKLGEPTKYEALIKTDPKRKACEYFRMDNNSKNLRSQQEQSEEDRFRIHEKTQENCDFEKEEYQKHSSECRRRDKSQAKDQMRTQEKIVEKDLTQKHFNQGQKCASFARFDHTDNVPRQIRQNSFHSQKYSNNKSCDLDSCRNRNDYSKESDEEWDHSEAKNSASINSLAMCKWRKQEKKEEIRSELLEPTKPRKDAPDNLEENTTKSGRSLYICKRTEREKKETENDDSLKSKPSPSRSKLLFRWKEESSQSEQTKRSKSKSLNIYSFGDRIKRERKESVDCLEAKSSLVCLYQLKQKPKLADLFGSSNRSNKDKNQHNAPKPRSNCDDVKVLCDLSYRFSHHSYGDEDGNIEDDCVCDIDKENHEILKWQPSGSVNNFYCMLQHKGTH
ncbi:uncharacterized protein LOC116805332 isoform X2 [Drosophila grimshawi]|uniref:uncharacterized protein LOC116805332 isoform X2 n=1 Tax=Drosophila grimshawi TaxID=7222 RepID=UPI000C86FCCD|nr:uncharacterized protein LOC116805332 isoform X2 [Drosophila grimshawi]